jgi:VanZ family protein/glutaredoxin
LTPLLRPVALWLPVVAYGVLVYYLSSLPQAAAGALIPDYILHAVEYLGLTLLITRALNQGLSRPLTPAVRFASVGLAVLYAVSDEIHQLAVPRRTASVKDVLADTFGAVLALGIAEAVIRIRSARLRRIPVTLYTKRQCHLCADARDALRRIGAEVPLEIREVDVGSDPALERQYGNEVPVILAGGRKVSKLVPDPAALRRRLHRLAAPGGAPPPLPGEGASDRLPPRSGGNP